MRPGLTRIAASALSITAGVAALFLLTPFLPRGILVFAVVGVVVLTGWALRAFWTHELRGSARWRGLFTAVISGLLMAMAYLWMTERHFPR